MQETKHKSEKIISLYKFYPAKIWRLGIDFPKNKLKKCKQYRFTSTSLPTRIYVNMVYSIYTNIYIDSCSYSEVAVNLYTLHFLSLFFRNVHSWYRNFPPIKLEQPGQDTTYSSKIFLIDFSPAWGGKQTCKHKSKL